MCGHHAVESAATRTSCCMAEFLSCQCDHIMMYGQSGSLSLEVKYAVQHMGCRTCFRQATCQLLLLQLQVQQETPLEGLAARTVAQHT